MPHIEQGSGNGFLLAGEFQTQFLFLERQKMDFSCLTFMLDLVNMMIKNQ